MKRIDKKAFGRLIEQAIQAKFPHQSAAGVAEQLGVSRSRFQKWTCGKALPNADTLPFVLDFFGIPAEAYVNLPTMKKEKKIS